MGSPLGPTLANVFLCFYGKKWLKNALLNLNQFCIEDMLMIFLFYSNQLIISKNIVTTLTLFGMGWDNFTPPAAFFFIVKN